jgi:serine/threonine protein kinase
MLSNTQTLKDSWEKEEIRYTAPELLNPQDKPTIQGDIYSLGMIFYEVSLSVATKSALPTSL